MNDDEQLCLCPYRKESCEVIKTQSGLDILPAPDACRACCKTKTPIAGFPNHVTTSLALREYRDVGSVEDAEKFRQEWGYLLRSIHDEDPDTEQGPGTELKRLLKKMLGIKPCQTCQYYARQMNHHGVEWCKANVETILDWLADNAKKRGWIFSKTIVRPVVMRAITNAERKMVGTMETFFERIYCVSLKRRQDRWDKFEQRINQSDWPFGDIRRFDAIDGKLCPPPQWWSQGGGAWGCYRSHMQILETCLNEKVDSVLFLEDDALPVDGFREKVEDFIANVPADWGMLYLGGQHLFVNKNPPKKVNDKVYIPWNVNRTHAFALRGKMMKIAYRHLSRIDWNKGHHIDHHLGRLHQQRRHPIYCPDQWLIGQAEDKSNISGRETPDRFWKDAEKIAAIVPEEELFVAVMGLHSSGSSCLAGCLYHLGLHLGNNLGGFYGNDPNKSCGFEASGLVRIGEGAVPFPSKEYKWKRGKIWAELKGWINDRRREAAQQQTVAAGKYPQLCRCGNQLRNICGDKLRVIAIDRPIDESIASMVKRVQGKYTERQIADHQRFLDQGKEQTLAELEPNQFIRVNYADLLADPAEQINRIVDFLEFEPLEGRFDKAVAYVDPSKRHINLEESEGVEVQ